MDLQAKYYDKKHRNVEFDAGELVLLSTGNLNMKGILGKLNKNVWDPLRLNNGLDSRHINFPYPKPEKFILCFIFPCLKSGILGVYRKRKKSQQMTTLKSKNYTMRLRKSCSGEKSREAEEF